MPNRPSRRSRMNSKSHSHENGAHQHGAHPSGAKARGNGSRGNGTGTQRRVAPRESLPDQPSIATLLSAPPPPLRAPAAETAGLDKASLLTALAAFKKGDFSVRLPVDLGGIDGKIADAFNDVIELNQRKIGRASCRERV